MQPLDGGQNLDPDGNRVKVSGNLCAIAVVPIAPVDTSLLPQEEVCL